MKKLLLGLLIISITPSLFAQITLIEQKEVFINPRSAALRTNVVVLCINNFVFIQSHSWKDSISMTQMMTESTSLPRYASAVPYKCEDYIRNMNK